MAPPPSPTNIPATWCHGCTQAPIYPAAYKAFIFPSVKAAGSSVISYSLSPSLIVFLLFSSTSPLNLCVLVACKTQQEMVTCFVLHKAVTSPGGGTERPHKTVHACCGTITSQNTQRRLWVSGWRVKGVKKNNNKKEGQTEGVDEEMGAQSGSKALKTHSQPLGLIWGRRVNNAVEVY